MFYCEPCRLKKGWPSSFGQSRGKCEVCGEPAICHDRPSSSLPAPVNPCATVNLPSDRFGFNGADAQAKQARIDATRTEVEEGIANLRKTFQDGVAEWMQKCFGPEISADWRERNHRFFEESTELVQACGMSAADAHMLVDYVFGRPVGERGQEVGGTMVTLAALCTAHGIRLQHEADTELRRINKPAMVEKIREKQRTKPKDSPLPTDPHGEYGITMPPQDRNLLTELYSFLARAHFERPEDEGKAAAFGARIKTVLDAPAPPADPLHFHFQIYLAMRDYFEALYQRQHGGVAQDKAMGKIQGLLGMHYDVYREARAQQEKKS
jgi:hypothetical protein